jgi:hypothetical protein
MTTSTSPEFNILTNTSKMPCKSFSLPAGDSCPFAVTTKCQTTGSDAICAKCYATKGFYKMFARKTQLARFNWVRQFALNGNYGEFANIMIGEIRKATRKNKFFRVHDSGDMFSRDYAIAWLTICAALPEVKFWIPTRSYQSPAILAILQAIAALPNVAVRPSALHFGSPAPQITGLNAGSTSGNAEAFQCPAPSQNGACNDCRMCWDKSTPVSYKRH